jgi:hypothetical protein
MQVATTLIGGLARRQPGLARPACLDALAHQKPCHANNLPKISDPSSQLETQVLLKFAAAAAAGGTGSSDIRDPKRRQTKVRPETSHSDHHRQLQSPVGSRDDVCGT